MAQPTSTARGGLEKPGIPGSTNERKEGGTRPRRCLVLTHVDKETTLKWVREDHWQPITTPETRNAVESSHHMVHSM
jgi:hypothetical protein